MSTCPRRRRRPRAGRRRRDPGRSARPAAHADALLHVVRAFEDPRLPIPTARSTPGATSSGLDLEFILADLGVTEKRLERLRRPGHHGTPAEREANDRELPCSSGSRRPVAGEPIRDVELDDDESKPHPRLPLPDPEARPRPAQRGRGRHRGRPRSWPRSPRVRRTAIAGRGAVRRDRDGDRRARAGGRRGLQGGARADGVEPRAGHPPVATACSGLIIFFTAGPDETRAWTIPDGDRPWTRPARSTPTLPAASSAPRSWRTRTWSSWARWPRRASTARLRSEGKTYLVRDGDVLEILFNV